MEEGFVLRQLLESSFPDQTAILWVVTQAHILSLFLRETKKLLSTQKQNTASSGAALVLQTSFSGQTETPVAEDSDEHVK